jgi:hypothetical protein
LYVRQRKRRVRRFGVDRHALSCVLREIRPGSIVMMRTGGTPRMVPLCGIRLIPGAREKGMAKNQQCPYPEPALVPLGEKPQV